MTDDLDTLESAENPIKTALLAGMTLANPIDINGVPAVLRPEGYSLHTFEEHLHHPKGTALAKITCQTVGSFLAYIERYAEPGRTAVFVDLENAIFVGVIDYHENHTVPGWAHHRCIYQCPITPEWERWKAQNKTAMSQAEFAAFIEDAALEIVEPPAADMLQIAHTLQAKKKVEFKSGIRLDNGAHQLTYNEQIDGTAGPTGQLKIPEQFSIGVQLFRGGDTYALQARFRYRINEGALRLWYELIRPHRVQDDAVTTLLQTIKQNLPEGTDLYEGTFSVRV